MKDKRKIELWYSFGCNLQQDNWSYKMVFVHSFVSFVYNFNSWMRTKKSSLASHDYWKNYNISICRNKRTFRDVNWESQMCEITKAIDNWLNKRCSFRLKFEYIIIVMSIRESVLRILSSLFGNQNDLIFFQRQSFPDEYNMSCRYE